MTASEGIEGETEALKRTPQLLGGDGKKARLEAVNVTHFGHVFQYRDRPKELAIGITHGGGAQTVAALGAADAHGQQGRFTLSSRGLLHGNSIADSIEDFFSTRGIG